MSPYSGLRNGGFKFNLRPNPWPYVAPDLGHRRRRKSGEEHTAPSFWSQDDETAPICRALDIENVGGAFFVYMIHDNYHVRLDRAKFLIQFLN